MCVTSVAATQADDATACFDIFQDMWTRRNVHVEALRAKPAAKRAPGLLFGIAWRFLGWRFVASGALLCVEVVADLVPAVLLNLLVSELELPPGEGTTTPGQLWLVCGGLLAIPMLRTVVATLRAALVLRAGLQLRNAIAVKLYRKVLRLSSKARREVSSGHIINVMTNDAR